MFVKCVRRERKGSDGSLAAAGEREEELRKKGKEGRKVWELERREGLGQ